MILKGLPFKLPEQPREPPSQVKVFSQHLISTFILIKCSSDFWWPLTLQSLFTPSRSFCQELTLQGAVANSGGMNLKENFQFRPISPSFPKSTSEEPL